MFHGGKEGEIRKQLVESDKLEAIITLTSGVFYSTGVSACILLLNNNKPASHVGKVCMIDASQIYTALRAQNVMTEENIMRVYELFKDYEDVMKYVKVASIREIRDKDYTLAVNNYIEKPAQEAIDPAVVRANYMAALSEANDATSDLMDLLRKEGYINE